MILDYKKIDLELLPALEKMPGLDINRENVAGIRELLGNQPRPPTQTNVMEEQRLVSGGEVDVPVYIYRKSDKANQSAVLWIHGGGYIIGNADEERARLIAETLDCTVFSVEYRLAPEHPFPAGPDDCFTVLEWMARDAEQLKINPAKIAIGGASAGAGMAAGVALMSRDKKGPALAYQLLLYPMIDNLHATDSGQYENHPIWNQGTSFNAWDMYLDGKPGLDASPYAAASRAADLAGLPPAYICVGSEDLFRDEDIEYARRLIAADVACEIAVFPGLYHAGDSFVPQAGVSKRLEHSFLNALGDALR